MGHLEGAGDQGLRLWLAGHMVGLMALWLSLCNGVLFLEFWRKCLRIEEGEVVLVCIFMHTVNFSW